MKTREKMLDRQRQYVKDHEGCNHLFACALTDEDKKNAEEMVRSGNPMDAAIGVAMLTGPCVSKASA